MIDKAWNIDENKYCSGYWWSTETGDNRIPNIRQNSESTETEHSAETEKLMPNSASTKNIPNFEMFAMFLVAVSMFLLNDSYVYQLFKSVSNLNIFEKRKEKKVCFLVHKKAKIAVNWQPNVNNFGLDYRTNSSAETLFGRSLMVSE